MRLARKLQKRGVGLLALFTLMLLVGLVCSSMYMYSGQQFHSVSKTKDYLKAKMLAEAGANFAYNTVKQDFDNVNKPDMFPETKFGDGSFDVSFTDITEKTATLVSIGKVGSAEARVSADLLKQAKQQNNLDTATFDDPVFTNYSMLAGDTIGWAGAGTAEGDGLIMANGALSINGNGQLNCTSIYSCVSITAWGDSGIDCRDAYAPKFVEKENKDNIKGVEHVQAVPTVKVPAVDLDPFYKHAAENGEVKTNFSFSSSYSPKGGVLWVVGTLSIAGNTDIKGCYIATGDIMISGSGSIKSTDGYPLLISREGAIKIAGSRDLEGLVYARGGNLEWSGGGSLKGSLIVALSIAKTGNSELKMTFSGAAPKTPGTADSSSNNKHHVVITAWQQ